MNDAELILRIQSKDAGALEAVMHRYTAYVLTVIRRVGVPPLSEEDAEELACDTFAALWRTADSIRDPFALKAYLGKIARNLAVGRRRQHKEDLPLEEDILIARDGEPERIAALHEQTAIIRAALEAMEPVRRSCMLRRYYYGEPLTDIAAALEIPLSTVKSHVYRGRKQLIEALKEWGYVYEDHKLSETV